MKGVISYWNRGAEVLYGWPAEHAVGKLAHELLKAASALPFEQIEAELLAEGHWEGEFSKTRKDGTQIVVASRWSLKRDDSGAPVAILVTSNDVTARKRAEEALHRSEAYLAEAQKLTHTGSYAYDGRTNTFPYWSEEHFRIWGFDPQQGPPDGETLLQRVHPEDREMVRQLSVKAMRERSDYIAEYRIVLPDGTVKY